jgi:tetratricopeptide (TPR) repeat protein
MNRRNESDFEDDSWEHSKPSFFGRVKKNYLDWSRNRQMIAAEKRELRSLNDPRKINRFDSDTTRSLAKHNEINNSEAIQNDRFLKKTGDDKASKSLVRAWIDERKIKRELRAEQKGYDQTLLPSGSNRSKQSSSNEDFGVGSIQKDNSENLERNIASTISREIVRSLWIKGFFRWFLGMAPAGFMIFFLIVQCLAGHSDRYVAQTQKLKEELPVLLEKKELSQSKLIGQRLFDCQLAQTEDIFRFFETIKSNGDMQEAFLFLKSSESLIKDSELGDFSYRYAMEILKENPSAPVFMREVLPRLQESMKRNITADKQTNARRILARFSSSQGDLESALKFLQPIENNDAAVATDVLWIRFNMSQETGILNLKATVNRLMGQIDDEISKNNGKLTDTLIGAKIKLFMIEGREAELRQWLAGLEGLTLTQKQTWSKEIDQISLANEMKRTPVDVGKVWVKLLPLLESNPDNLLWNRMATMIWAMPVGKRNEEAFAWVQKRLESSQVNLDFLRQAALAGHTAGAWQTVRPIYERLVSRDPNDVAALNNLAGIYYKFPPYNYPLGLEMINKAITLAPDNIGIQETKAQILARMGKTDEAKSILERCLVVFPNEWNIHNTLAQIYQLEGQNTRASAHRERLQSLKKPINAPLVDSIGAELKPSSSQ